MAILKIARMGHPVLRQKTRVVDRRDLKTAEFQQLIDDMMLTMREYTGAGLAAPQVHVPVRLFVALADDSGTEPVAFVNPEVRVVDRAVVTDWEGCLSIPGIRGQVPRAQAIVVRALDRRGERIELTLRHFAARVVQHEQDHLDGVLFLDRMQSLASLAYVSEHSTSAAF